MANHPHQDPETPNLHGGGHDHTGQHFHGRHHHQSSGPVSLLMGFVKHSHAELDVIDSAVDTSRAGMRALKISVVGLGLTALVQILVVSLSGSIALLSESIHNFSDVLTALPLGIAFILGRKKADAHYTYGYGRAEDLAGIFIILIISVSTLIALYESILRLIHPQEIHQIPLVIFAGFVGFAGNEAVAIYRIRIGRKIGSAALTADGLHARSDGLASLSVVVGAIGAALGFEYADPIASLVIGIAIIGVLREAARDIYRRLMDSVDPRLVDKAKEVLASTPGIEGIGAVRIRWIGHDLRAEADILSDSELSLVESHRISEEAHHRLLHEIPRLSEAVIHTSPKYKSGDSAHLNIAHHFPERSDD